MYFWYCSVILPEGQMPKYKCFCIRNAVKQENNLIKDSAGFSTNIQELVTDVRENKTQCELLVKTVQNLVDNTQRGAERNFQSKDIQINGKIFRSVI